VKTDQSGFLIFINPSSGVPVYRQLMDQIRFLIAGGVLKPGDPLPSTRSLSSDLGVNPMTISKAYSFLERDGLVERRPGRPLRVIQLPVEQLRKHQLDELRAHLTDTVAIIRQLGIDPEEAIRLFKTMLAEDQPSKIGEDAS